MCKSFCKLVDRCTKRVFLEEYSRHATHRIFTWFPNGKSLAIVYHGNYHSDARCGRWWWPCLPALALASRCPWNCARSPIGPQNRELLPRRHHWSQALREDKPLVEAEPGVQWKQTIEIHDYSWLMYGIMWLSEKPMKEATFNHTPIIDTDYSTDLFAFSY